jgi:cellulose synthase (UDP-forming)
VTEDAHTALKMHRRGYTTAYINIPMAAGLATDSLSGHVGQRIRWARGMAQIFRTDNPFLGKGLSLFQRICYSNAMLHFFYGIPRLIFLTAPLTFLYFEMHIIKAAASMIALYVLPHIIQSNLANSHMQGPHRHSFWAEVYETVLAWYITLPTTIAMFKPSAGTFNVTAKGGLIEHAFFDWTISKPYILLILVNFGGFLLGLVRLFYWNPDETGTVLLNMIWTVYNLLMLGAAIGVATEARQVRISHRVAARFSAGLRFKDGTTLACHTQDYSMTGLGLEVALDLERYLDELVKVSLWRGDDEYVFPARIIAYKKGSAGVRFENLDLKQEADLVQCTFARADAWTEWKNVQDHDHPMQGLKEITMLGLAGYKNLLSLMLKSLRDKKERAIGALANFGRNR